MDPAQGNFKEGTDFAIREEEDGMRVLPEETTGGLKHRGESKKKLGALKPLPKLLSPLAVSVCARACVHACMVMRVEMCVCVCVCVRVCVG